MRHWLTTCALFLAGLVLAGGRLAPAAVASEAGDPMTEYRVKAAILEKFFTYVTWPAARPAVDGDWQITVVDDSPEIIDAIRSTISRSAPAKRRIEVVQARDCTVPEGSQMVFVTRNAPPVSDEAYANWLARGILVVGETSNFARNSGVIGIVIKESKPRLEINLQNARTAGLVISSRLSSLSEIVRPGS